MLTFIHLTDTHLVPRGEMLYGLSPADRLDAAVAAINARHAPGSAAPAAFVIVTGDLTHWGKPAAYAELRAVLSRLAMPVHPMLGNHDDRAAFRAVFPQVPVDAGGFIQRVVDSAQARLLPSRPHG